MSETEYASAERTDKKLLLEIYDTIKSTLIIEDLMNKLDQTVFILNSNRQIVYVNKAALKTHRIPDIDSIIGLRPGEVFKCKNSFCSNGCGTSFFCRECGAVNSILKTQKEFAEVLDECVICSIDGKTYELAVSTRPFKFNDNDYTFLSITDISMKKRMDVLEKIFFHDVINIAGGIHSMLKLMCDEHMSERQNISELLLASSEQLLNEINAHKILKAAESNDLLVQFTNAESIQVLNKAANMAEHLKCALGKMIYIDVESDEFYFNTDETLLNRVLLNMITNALEASSSGDKVTVSSKTKDGKAHFSVHNQQAIGKNIQRNIFVKSFTTKKRGSGLGTHSIKLLTERYLHGNVSFVSEENTGTTFTVTLHI